MLHSYFKLNKRSEQLINLFEGQFELKNNKKTHKKITKLNEFQFFQLCLNAFCLPVKLWEQERLELLFIKKSRKINSNPNYLPFVDDSEQEPNYVMTEDYVEFSCSKKLDDFVDYIINSNEYTELLHKQKLLALSEEINTNLVQSVIIINSYFLWFLDNEAQNLDFWDNKIHFCLLIKAALNDFEDSLYLVLENIFRKIEYLSKKETIDSESYNLNINDKTIRKLYKELERNLFIDITKTSEEDFFKVLKYNWKEHKSIIHFEMNNIQFKYFIDLFCDRFDVKISLKKIETAKNIKNKNGYIKSASVYSSKSKSKLLPKGADLIEKIIISTK